MSQPCRFLKSPSNLVSEHSNRDKTQQPPPQKLTSHTREAAQTCQQPKQTCYQPTTQNALRPQRPLDPHHLPHRAPTHHLLPHLPRLPHAGPNAHALRIRHALTDNEPDSPPHHPPRQHNAPAPPHAHALGPFAQPPAPGAGRRLRHPGAAAHDREGVPGGVQLHHGAQHHQSGSDAAVSVSLEAEAGYDGC